MQGIRFHRYNKRVIYLYFSAEPELARRSALKALREKLPHRNESNYISFNMAETALDTVTSECDYLPLGYESKAVLAEDCSFLAKATKKQSGVKGKGSKKEKKVDPALDRFAAYCRNPNPLIDLFLVTYSETLDETNPAVIAIKQTGKLLPLPMPEPARLIGAASTFFAKRNCPAPREACQELVERVDGDYGRYLSEREKIALYANGEPVTLSMVEKLVAPKMEENTFEISNALLKGDTASAIRIYHDLKVFGADEVRLINMLATQLRFLDQVSFLYREGYNSTAIAERLNVKPYRVSVSLRSVTNADPMALWAIQEELYETEKSILSGIETPRFAFERFLANFTL